jgi:hypothetical protein
MVLLGSLIGDDGQDWLHQHSHLFLFTNNTFANNMCRQQFYVTHMKHPGMCLTSMISQQA